MAGNDILSRIQILLDADTARFEQGMQDAQDTSESVFKKISTSAKAFAGAVASSAVTSATALAAYTNEYVKNINEIEKFAYISDASFVQFQKMAAGADAAGVSADQLSSMYKDFNEKLGEFVTVGAGGAVDFFEQVASKTEGSADAAMKLAKEMANLSGPQALEMYVKKMEQANLSQEQMSFLMESMASDTTALIPLLVNGGEGMRLWGEAADRAGVIIDDNTRKAAKALGVDIKLLDMQLEGAKNQVMQSVIPAFVDISSAFLSTEGNTISLKGASEVLGDSLRRLAKIGLGVSSVFDIVGTVIGGTAAAMTSKAVTAEDVIKDLEAKLDGYGKKFEKISGEAGIPEGDRKRLIEIEQQRLDLQNQVAKARQSQTKGAQDWLDKQNEVEKNIKSATKAQSDLNKKLEEQRRIQDSLIYEFSDKPNQMRLDYELKVSDIDQAGFDSKTKSDFIKMASERYNAEKELYLAEQKFELNQHKYSEIEKLNEEFKLNNLRINANIQMNDKDYNAQIKSLTEKHNQELVWAKLESEQRISDAGSMLRTDLQNVEIKYDFERQQILKNSKLSEDEQKRLVALSMASEEFQKRDNLNSATAAWGGTFADLSGTGDQYRLDQERFSRYDESQALFDAQMALADSAAEREAIWQAHNDRMYLIDKKYQEDKLNLGLDSAQNELGTMTSVWGQILGEQSATYAAMASASKAFAVFQALMNVPTTFSNVYASVSQIPMIGPYIAPVMAAAAAATQVAQATMIKGYNLTGQAHDGIDQVPETGTWLLKKGERVTTERTSKKLDKKLDEVGAAERQIRETKQADPSVQFNPDIAIFDSRETAERWMMGKGGEKAVLYHLKRNKSNLGI